MEHLGNSLKVATLPQTLLMTIALFAEGGINLTQQPLLVNLSPVVGTPLNTTALKKAMLRREQDRLHKWHA